MNTHFLLNVVACIKAGGYPSPLQYKGFPKSVCTSVNNVVCHGIPDDRELCDGDIINIDVTVREKSTLDPTYNEFRYEFPLTANIFASFYSL